MSGLTHPADERRVREIVREELAARLDVGDAALDVPDGLDNRGQVLGQVPVSVSGLLLGYLRDVLHERGGDWHVVGNRSGDSGAELASGGRVTRPVTEINHRKTPYVARAVTRYGTGAILAASRWLQRRAWVRRAVPSGRPSGTTKATFELAPDDAATVLDWIRGAKGGAE